MGRNGTLHVPAAPSRSSLNTYLPAYLPTYSHSQRHVRSCLPSTLPFRCFAYFASLCIALFRTSRVTIACLYGLFLDSDPLALCRPPHPVSSRQRPWVVHFQGWRTFGSTDHTFLLCALARTPNAHLQHPTSFTPVTQIFIRYLTQHISPFGTTTFLPPPSPPLSSAISTPRHPHPPILFYAPLASGIHSRR